MSGVVGYGDRARAYRKAGWQGVLPLPPGEKYPLPEGFTGRDGRWPTDDELAEWRLKCPGHNLALRLPEDVVGLDFDLYKEPGARTELEQHLGRALPPTWSSSSRDDGSGIFLYRVPPPPAGKRWRSPVVGLDVVRFDHRYVTAAPSTHPDSGRRYFWRDDAGEIAKRPPAVDDLAELPFAAIEPLLGDDLEYDEREPVDFALTDGEPSPAVASRLETGLYACTGDAGSRHDRVLPVVTGLVRAAELGEPGVRPALTQLRDRFVGEVGADRPKGQAQARHEFDDMVAYAADTVAKTEPPSSNGSTSTSTAAAPGRALALPKSFWTERESLEHIRRAAWSQGRSPEPVLGAVLARAVADTNHRAVLDTAVGAPCGLSLLVAILGPPGTGKSSSAAIAVRLMPRKLLSEETDGVPPGSGEGLVELLFGTVEVAPGEDGRPGKTERRQVHNHCYVYCDESEVLVRQANRASGSTILPVLRSIFSSSTLGQSNATKDRHRVVPGGRYVFGVVLGLQPDRAGALFDDSGAGSPQRMLWVPTQTPVPAPGDRPRWPGPLKWGPAPSALALNNVIAVDDDVIAEIQRNDYERQTKGCDLLDEHQDLIRAKVGAGLALLDQHAGLRTEDWALAGQVVDLSRAVRAAAIRRVEELGANQEGAYRERLAGRAVATDEAVRARRVVDAARAIAERTYEEKEWTVHDARCAVRRESDVFDAALAHALAEEWVAEADELNRQGKPKRVLRPGPRKPR